MSDTSATMPDPANPHPSDGTTLIDVIEAYRSTGFDADFTTEEPSSVRCDRCGSVVSPNRMVVHSLRRMEGASDPADMLAVVATTCPVCKAQGTLVLGFGPMASGVDTDVLHALQDRRDDDLAPRDGPGTATDGPLVG